MILHNTIYKNKGLILLLFLVSTITTGCFKDFKKDHLFKESLIEFDAATWLSNAPGKTFPIIGPLDKGGGEFNYQVNLLGEQKAIPITLQYRVVADESTAIEGVHYKLKDDGRFTVDGNSSTGNILIEILDFQAESGTNLLVLELVGGEGVSVSQNYKRIGVSISLVGPPSEAYDLHTQLGPDSYYNSIYFDEFNPHLPSDIKDRIKQAGENLANYSDKTRRLQALYIYFNSDNKVNINAQYYGGGGNSLTAGPVATWTYDLKLDENGVGRFEFVEANGNGNSQKNNFAPILADYFEKHEFKVDWVEPGMGLPDHPDVKFGRIFRTDDPSSFILGTLETLTANGSARPYPSSPAFKEIFSNGDNGYFSSLYIDPDDPAQSLEFQNRWDDGKTYIEGLAGRQLHKMMFYFNPNFNFQDLRLITYYYSSSGGKFIGQVRFQFKVDYDGNVKPFEFFYENGNGRSTRSPEIVDDFLMNTEFKMSRSGNRVRFTSVSNSSVYFEGELGNNPVSTSGFWPE